ncbi:MAG: FGGY family carbohydrate kinase, partial [Saprospiraceae bacterium]|nr:FGGY family carbohydrate kinase [Saprospiraceae bacterium]
ISYQMHGLVLIDKDHTVLRPAIIWCDSRAVSIGRDAYLELGMANCLEHYLNAPGNFTASRLKWVKDNEPSVYEKIYKILLPGDYIAMKLTGEVMTTIPGLSEGILWDFKERKVAEKILDYFGFSQSLIPNLVPTFSYQGRLTKNAAEATGLAEGTPITYRAGDQPNNAFSLGVINPGQVAANSGTSGVIYGIVDSMKADSRSRVNSFAHVNYEENYDRIGMLSCLNGAGIQYSWIKNQIARASHSYEDMERMVSSVSIGSEGLCIFPFGNGAERLLENQAINSHFANLQFNRHTRGHLYRAALEGVAFSFIYGINILRELGLKIHLLRVAGDNLFRSQTFGCTIATLLDQDIEVVETTGAVGAARGAGVAIGAFQSIEEAVQEISACYQIEPKLDRAACERAYQFWLSNLQRILEGHSGSNKKIFNYSELNRLASDLEKSRSQLNKGKSELSKLSLRLDSKNRVLDELNKSLHILANQDNPYTIQDGLKRLQHKLKQSIDSDEDWASFEEHYDLIHDDFFRRLRDSYPQLTMTDFRLSGYLRMQLSNKEIAERLNLSVRGVETRRYRLNKKLGLHKGRRLKEFLRKF